MIVPKEARRVGDVPWEPLKTSTRRAPRSKPKSKPKSKPTTAFEFFTDVYERIGEMIKCVTSQQEALSTLSDELVDSDRRPVDVAFTNTELMIAWENLDAAYTALHNAQNLIKHLR